MPNHPESSRQNILVADDDPILLELALSSLTAAGYRVSRAENGIEAMALVDDNEFDLIITDLDMPGLDGFGLIEAVRSRDDTRYLPVVVITNHGDFKSIERAYALGATSFVIKPINWSQFAHHVRYVMRASRQEAELRSARDAAEAASQVKSNVLSVVTHEFRTPLHQIIGFSDLLDREEEGLTAPSQNLDFAALIQEAAANLDHMVSDMLIVSRLLANHPTLTEQDFYIEKLLANAATSMDVRAAEKGIEIVEHKSDIANIDLVCDQIVFERALSHLIGNAIEHSPKNGAIIVGARLARRGQLICFVKDDGPGMKPERVDGLLDPLSQGDMSLNCAESGFGIGLAIARLTAEAHGGQFLIETAPGAGTTAALVFPANRVRTVDQSAINAVGRRSGRHFGCET